MSVPPKFADIGKSAADLLSKDFPVGSTKLEVKTTASNGVSFTVSGNQDVKSGVIAGELKTKFADKSKGLTITEYWTTSNVLGGEVEVADQLVNGLKSTLTGSLLPAAGQKNAKVSLEYKQDYIFSNAALDVFKGPSVSADLSVGADGFVFGGDVAYNVKDGKLSKFGGALGYTASDYAVSVHAFNNCQAFAAAIYHRLSSDVQTAAKAVWDKKSASANVAIEVGTKYTLDDNSFLKAKINNAGLLGLGYTQTVRSGVKVALGGSFDIARFHENAHKLGLSLTFEA